MSTAAAPVPLLGPKSAPTANWSRVTDLWDDRDWVTEAKRSIAKLAGLPDNWDGAGSPAPQAAALSEAFHILVAIEAYDMPTTRVGPVSGGGLGMEWQHAGRTLLLEIMRDGAVEYLKSEEDSADPSVDRMEDGEVPRDQLKREVRQLALWLMSY